MSIRGRYPHKRQLKLGIPIYWVFTVFSGIHFLCGGDPPLRLPPAHLHTLLRLCLEASEQKQPVRTQAGWQIAVGDPPLPSGVVSTGHISLFSEECGGSYYAFLLY